MRYILLVCVAVLSFTSPLTSATSPQHIGDYTVVKTLGSGDQASVYLAQDSNQNQYAIKVFYTPSEMQKVHPERKSTLASFFNEDGSSKAASDEYSVGKKLNHPNIMKLYNISDEITPDGERHAYISMQYIKGKNLAKTKAASLSKHEALSAMTALLNSLRHAFSKGLIHADLWDENLYIDENNELKIIDLGSFDPLPVVRKGEKSRGRYKTYFKVIKSVLERLIVLGDFSRDEQKELRSLIETAGQNSKNCQITLETSRQAQANLLDLENQLEECMKTFALSASSTTS